MDKETLSNYGWIVIAVLVLAIMIALATPFGSYISDAVKSTTEGLFGANQNALSTAGIDIENQVLGGNNNKIPNGATYKVKATGKVLSGGDKFPTTPATRDIYEEGDYKYTYYSTGWAVLAKDTTKSSYGEILSEIAGKPVTDMSGTFQACKSLTTAPTIPDSVTVMAGTFRGCTSLTTAPVIPNSVTDMTFTFDGCTSLTTAPAIPDSVVVMGSTFGGCYSLEGSLECNANPKFYDMCLCSTQITSITGSCSQATKDALLATK